LVSHDRVFLNNVVNRIVEIDGGKLISYAGNYDVYENEKEKRLRLQQAAFESQQERIRQIERFIERNRARKDRARQVQSRIKLLEKMERIDPPIQEGAFDFDFPPPPRAPKVLIELNNVSKSYDTKAVYTCISLCINRGDRIAFLGPNGAGKTTLMRVLRNEVDFEGERSMGAGVQLAVFTQEQMDRLVSHLTVLRELMSVAPNHSQGQLRKLLGGFLFRGDDVFKRASVLSGGEKSRLTLCKMLVQPANLLLLDEPTNHLDIPSREILEAALRQYGGTICLITHDRHLINSVANKILVIRNQKVEIYPGNFDDYQSIWKKRESLSSSMEEEPFPRQKGVVKRKTRVHKHAEAEWRNRLFREATPLRERLSGLERNIEEMTKKMDKITVELSREDTYRNPEQLRQLNESFNTMKTQVSAWTRQWESTVFELEELEKRFEESKPKRSDQESVPRSQESE
jgi:ATP-binding cassette subfamily F protein 3